MKPTFRTFLRIALIIVLFYFLYAAGMPLAYLILFLVITLGFWFIRGHIYSRIDRWLKHLFPWIKKLPSWAEKALIIIAFIIVYILLKDLVFFILKEAGVDVQAALMQTFNKSAS